MGKNPHMRPQVPQGETRIRETRVVEYLFN